MASAGNLTLLSTATTTSSIGPLTTGDITGNVNIQSDFTGGFRTSKGISSPINDFSNPAPPKNIYQQLKDYILVTGPGGTANGFDAGGGSPFQVTIKKYNEAADPSPTTQQFTPIANITEKIKTGEGFFALFRGDRNINPSQKLNAPFATPEPVTVAYTGTINKGDVTVDLTYTNYPGDIYNGFNLIGNPYPSTIDWNSGAITKTNVANTIYVYKTDGSFAVWSNGEGTNQATSIVQPGQAFYVPAQSGGGQVIFRESSKAPAASPMRFLSLPGKERLAQTKESLTMQNVPKQSAMANGKLRMTLDDGINTDEALVIFKKGSEEQLTSEDAVYFGAGSTVSLASLSTDEKRITINFMPEIDQVNRVKLFVSATSAVKLNLNFTDISAAVGTDVLLKDNYLNTLTNVKSNRKYEFTVDKSNAATFGGSRFELLFQPPVTLPIKLVSFTVKKNLDGAELIWITSTEQNNDRFELERSTDGKLFTKIGQVNGAGNSSTNKQYNYLDKDPANGVNYYRLKQLDKNGEYTYSEPVALNYGFIELKEGIIKIYPNPAADMISVMIDEKNCKSVTINIYDLQGRKVSSKTLDNKSNISLPVTNLGTGTYILEVSNTENKSLIGRTKLIKN